MDSRQVHASVLLRGAIFHLVVFALIPGACNDVFQTDDGSGEGSVTGEANDHAESPFVESGKENSYCDDHSCQVRFFLLEFWGEATRSSVRVSLVIVTVFLLPLAQRKTEEHANKPQAILCVKHIVAEHRK